MRESAIPPLQGAVPVRKPSSVGSSLAMSKLPTRPRVALLTAGRDIHYALGLGPALAEKGIEISMVGNSEMEGSAKVRHRNIRFFNLRGDQAEDAGLLCKVLRVLNYYIRLIRFAVISDAEIFHILWLNKFVHFDRTLLNLYYRALGKRLIFTAHNVNTESRDLKDSFWNRLTLRWHYRLMDHIFVHTLKMKTELIEDYALDAGKVTVVRFPLNDVTPQTSVSSSEARDRLGLDPSERILLFFGNVAPYKGLEDLIQAVPLMRQDLEPFRLLVVGRVKNGEADYSSRIQELIARLDVSDVVTVVNRYVAEEEVEFYFKAAHLLILPYRRIFQSGVLVLAYKFGLPVLAADVGSLRECILEGKTGFLCAPCNPPDLADQALRYFQSELFQELSARRSSIIEWAHRNFSWEELADRTMYIYDGLSSVASHSVKGQDTPILP